MVKNVGHPLDIGLRIVIGTALISLLVLLHGNLRWIGLIGVIPILTSVFRWCPGWALLGINTVKKR
jgi:Inner membrane protein YgaP-like, transmembrane domain